MGAAESLSEVEKTDYWLNPEEIKIPEDLPQPQLWRMLIAPVQPRRKSAGGIIVPEQARDSEEHLAYIGKVVAVGPMVGRKPEWPEGMYDIKVGDWVVFGRYAGQRFQFKDLRLLLLDDDAVMAKCSGPEGFRIYI